MAEHRRIIHTKNARPSCVIVIGDKSAGALDSRARGENVHFIILLKREREREKERVVLEESWRKKAEWSVLQVDINTRGGCAARSADFWG